MSLGFFVTGVGSLLTNLVIGLRAASKSDGDLSLARLEAVVEAQGSWIRQQAEQIAVLSFDGDALRTRVVATEQHARDCDRKLEKVNDFIRANGLTPP